MPHDKHGNPLNVGDRVSIPAVVTEVYGGETACNVQLQVQSHDAAPEGAYAPGITLTAALVERTAEPEPTDAEEQPAEAEPAEA